MNLGLVGQAIAMFAVTNVDDILLLSLYFGQAQNDRSQAARIVAGQYLGFTAILAASVVGALGAGLLPEAAIAYLGLIPLLLGLRAGWRVWRQRRDDKEGSNPTSDGPAGSMEAPGVWEVAGITLANGGDNIAVYIPVFAAAEAGGMAVYVAVFLIGVAVWCAAGHYFATRPLIARALARWGHVLLPLVLVGIGTLILVKGGAFGL